MISIIVPVYNTAKYLPECLDSILNQEYGDLEIILVDDGSTDESLKVCEKYAEIDNRVIVYHKENSGVSDTRNFGLSRANGEYISFCDSDDVIKPELYQLLYETMIQQGVDRVVCGYAYLYEDGHTVYSKPRLADGRYDADYILPKMIDDGTMSGFLFSGVYNSLFKKKIIYDNNLHFESDIKYNEDSLFSFKYMLSSQSIYSLQSLPTYLYRQHSNSSTSRRTVGDKYAPLRKALCDMKLSDLPIDFELQMKRRTVTEALWQILDISVKQHEREAVRDIRAILNSEEVKKCLDVISAKELNQYKRYYYYLMKFKASRLLYISSSKLLPFLTKYISR